MKIFNVLVEYTNFEDEDNNYSEIRGSFSTKEKAIEMIKKQVEDEKELDMKLCESHEEVKDIEKIIEQWGYMDLEQECGWGETRIILYENELDKE